jgi:hypothetical protein
MADILQSLELSVRATNVLADWGHVKTLDDFLALDKRTVMLMPNAGVRTWKEIEQMQKFLRREAPPAPVLAQDAKLRDVLAMSAPVTWGDVHAQIGWRDDKGPLTDSERGSLWAVMACLRYEYADAMLEARKENGKG